MRNLAVSIAHVSWMIENGIADINSQRIRQLNQMTLSLLHQVNAMQSARSPQNFKFPCSSDLHAPLPRSIRSLYEQSPNFSMNGHSKNPFGLPQFPMDPRADSLNIDSPSSPSLQEESLSLSDPSALDYRTSNINQKVIKEKKKRQRITRVQRTLAQNPNLRCTFCGIRDTPVINLFFLTNYSIIFKIGMEERP